MIRARAGFLLFALIAGGACRSITIRIPKYAVDQLEKGTFTDPPSAPDLETGNGTIFLTHGHRYENRA